MQKAESQSQSQGELAQDRPGGVWFSTNVLNGSQTLDCRELSPAVALCHRVTFLAKEQIMEALSVHCPHRKARDWAIAGSSYGSAMARLSWALPIRRASYRSIKWLLGYCATGSQTGLGESLQATHVTRVPYGQAASQSDRQKGTKPRSPRQGVPVAEVEHSRQAPRAGGKLSTGRQCSTILHHNPKGFLRARTFSGAHSLGGGDLLHPNNFHL